MVDIIRHNFQTKILDVTPSQAAGVALNDNFKRLLDGWFPLINIEDYDDTPASTLIITTNQDLRVPIGEGFPIRYRLAGVEQYGIIEGMSSTNIITSGAPLTIGAGDLQALAVGRSSNIITKELHIGGVWSPGADTDAYENVEGKKLRWGYAPAALVKIRGVSKVVSGTNPTFNIQIGNADVMPTDITLTASGLTGQSAVNIDVANYKILVGEEIEITTSLVSTSTDFSVWLTFVLLD